MKLSELRERVAKERQAVLEAMALGAPDYPRLVGKIDGLDWVRDQLTAKPEEEEQDLLDLET